MRFWDSSALVPLLAAESQSETVRTLIAEDPSIAVAFITPVEIESAIWRKSRHDSDDLARERALRRLAVIEQRWRIVNGSTFVVPEARRLVRDRHLRAADALQLACAIVFRTNTNAGEFVTLDHELAVAARAEGFTVLPAQ